MTFIIGDVHGEISKLKKLISVLDSEDSNAELVFIGDYLDKGENVLKTIIYLSELNAIRKCIFLYGNHDYLWLNLNENDKKTEKYLMNFGGKMTLHSLKVKTFTDAKQMLLKHFSFFFELLKPYWENDQYVATHSGIDPADYQILLENIPLKKLLFNRYDFIRQTQLYLGRYKVIFGHTGFYSPFVDQYKIGIDTAACFQQKQPLTAFCPEHTIFIDSDNRRYSLNSVPTNQCPVIPRNKPWREND